MKHLSFNAHCYFLRLSALWALLLLWSSLCPAQTTERKMLSGYSTDDGVEWDFF